MAMILPAVLIFLAWDLPACASGTQLVAAARAQIGVTTGYDPAYRKLAYPGGDVPQETGVCCDVVVQALRKQDVDLQKLLHEDMTANFDKYPKKWGLKAADSNIDHRRVLNLACYFNRHGWAMAVSSNAAAYLPGDIVTWDLGKGLTHIGIVSDKRAAGGTPSVIHNIGNGAQEEDILFRYVLTGHFRKKEKEVTDSTRGPGRPGG